MKQFFTFCFVAFLIFFTGYLSLYAEEITWTEVAKMNNEIQFVDSSSLRYDKRGLLWVVTKYSQIDPVQKKTINTNSYLLAVDCDNRLFAEFPLNSEFKKVKNWKETINNKLIKKTIINSCSF